MNLTQDQLRELEQGEPVRVMIGETPCVIVREDVYQHAEMETGLWTKEEMDLLACEAADLIQDDLDAF